MHLQPDFLVDSTKTGTMADLFCLSHGDDALGPEIGGGMMAMWDGPIEHMLPS